MSRSIPVVETERVDDRSTFGAAGAAGCVVFAEPQPAATANPAATSSEEMPRALSLVPPVDNVPRFCHCAKTSVTWGGTLRRTFKRRIGGSVRSQGRS